LSLHPRRRTTLSERLYRRFLQKFWSRDLGLELQLHAKRDSVAYVLERMANAIMFRDRWDLLEFALERAPAEGLLLEFGVADGASTRFLAARTPRVVHGFDSFEGLPEDWTGTAERRGKFTQAGRLPSVPANARLHKGWFNETVPGFLAAEQGKVAFVHVDCDIYSSTKLVFDQIGGRLAAGAVIVFDEYFNYPGWRQHEWKAFQEWVAATGMRYEYIGFTQKNGHVAVQLA
jgi:hypothetical protein